MAIWGLVLAAVAVGGPTAARACFVGDQFNTYNRDRTRYVHCECKGSDVFGESQCTCIEYAIHRVGVRYGLKTLWVMARFLGWWVGVARPGIFRR